MAKTFFDNFLPQHFSLSLRVFKQFFMKNMAKTSSDVFNLPRLKFHVYKRMFMKDEDEIYFINNQST